MLVRPSSLFVEDMSKKAAFTEDRYGSVKKVYIVCVKDQAMPVDFQRWQIEIVGVNKVKEIESAGHMAMLSNPQQVFQALLDIAYSGWGNELNDHFLQFIASFLSSSNLNKLQNVWEQVLLVKIVDGCSQ